jgi:glycerol-3-phosphate acyltransferase PlsY
MLVLAGMALGYLLGSIPFGLLLARAGGAGDIRKIGSGNIGATNVLRTGNKGLAALTLLLDGAKGWLAPVLVDRFDGSATGPALAAAIGALLGHCFPVWLGFKGGKGVATMLGVSLALVPGAGLAYALVWLGMLAGLRTSSLAGMSAALAAPLAAALLGRPDEALVLAGLAALVLFQHRENIARLRAGTEPRVGQKADS